MFFGAVWGVVLSWWYQSNRLPVIGEVAFYLVGLPGGLLITFWVVKRLIKGPPQAAATPTPAEPLPAAEPAEPAEPVKADRTYRVAVLGAGVRSALGTSTASICEAALSGRRAPLDEELVDRHGFPVFAGRVAGLNIERTHDTLLDHADSVAWSDEQVRTLALLEEAFDDVMPVAMRRFAAREQDAAPGLFTSRLRTTVLVAHDWSEAHREGARAWLHAGIIRRWPAAPLMLEVTTVASPTEALAQIDRISVTINQANARAIDAPDMHAMRGTSDTQAYVSQTSRPQSLAPFDARLDPRVPVTDECFVLAAADSAIGDATLESWQASDTLFSSRCKHGLIPGEAATALLFASTSSHHADAIELTRAALTERATSADDEGKTATSAATLLTLTDEAFGLAGIQADAVATVVGDSGARAARVLEFTQLTSGRFPSLELNDDCLMLDAGCGHTGIAATLLAVALGTHLAAQRGRPSLIASLSTSLERGVMIALPPVAPTV